MKVNMTIIIPIVNVYERVCGDMFESDSSHINPFGVRIHHFTFSSGFVPLAATLRKIQIN